MELLVVLDLGIGFTYETGIVVCRAGSLHASEGNAFDARKNTVFANQPVGVFRFLILDFLLDHDAKHVGNMLIQGTGLALVVQGARVLSNGMRQLVSDHVDGASKIAQELATISKDHLSLF